MIATSSRVFRLDEALATSIAVLRRRWIPFGIVSLVILSPSLVLDLAPAWLPLDSMNVWLVHAISVLLILASMALGYLVDAILVYGTIQDLRGRQVGIADCLSHGAAIVLPVLAVALLTWILTLVGAVLLVVPAIVVTVALWVAVPVAVAERRGPVASLR